MKKSSGPNIAKIFSNVCAIWMPYQPKTQYNSYIVSISKRTKYCKGLNKICTTVCKALTSMLNNKSSGQNYAPLQPNDLQNPIDYIQMDLVCPFQSTSTGN